MKAAAPHLMALAAGAVVGLVLLQVLGDDSNAADNVDQASIYFRPALLKRSVPLVDEPILVDPTSTRLVLKLSSLATASPSPDARPRKSPEDTLRGAMHTFSGVTSEPRSLARNLEATILGSQRVMACGEQMVVRSGEHGRIVDLSLVLTGVIREGRMRLQEPEVGDVFEGNIDPPFRDCVAAALADAAVSCPTCRDAELTFEWRLQGGFNRPSP